MTDEIAVLERLYDRLITETPYYDELGVECETIEEGRVVATAPYSETTQAPTIAPDSMHGGVIATFVDGAAMGAIIAAKGEPVPLVTTELSVTFHDPTRENVVIEGQLVDSEGPYMTARVEIYPESEWETENPDPTASGEATARLLE